LIKYNNEIIEDNKGLKIPVKVVNQQLELSLFLEYIKGSENNITVEYTILFCGKEYDVLDHKHKKQIYTLIDSQNSVIKFKDLPAHDGLVYLYINFIGASTNLGSLNILTKRVS
jgi:hypothetical protein